MIIKKLQVGVFAANCYIVGSEKSGEGMIIDPGDNPVRILKTVEELRLKIKLIVLTHTHADHVSALKRVKEATGAGVGVHSDEAGSLQHQGIIGALFSRSLSAPHVPERLLKDGEVIDIGDLHFTVLHTPGHTRGGICLYGEGVVFTGDTLFHSSIGRSDFQGGNHRQLISGIHQKLMVLPDDTIVYPGHGPDSTIGEERRKNPFLREPPKL